MQSEELMNIKHKPYINITLFFKEQSEKDPHYEPIPNYCDELFTNLMKGAATSF